MKRGIMLRTLTQGWARSIFQDLYPGGHAAVFGGYTVPLEAEDVGFEVRDCITVIGPERALIWLLRKPIEEKNVASQTLKTGTGGIFIDGCRVGTADTRSVSSSTALGLLNDDSWRAKPVEAGSACGRWPPNLVLVHQEGCKQSGTRKVRGSNDTTGVWGKGNGYQGGWKGQPGQDYTSEDGTETIVAWECAPECFVARLDEQSGVLSSGALPTSILKGQLGRSGTYGQAQGYKGGTSFEANSGGASRFFPQFANEQELATWIFTLILGREPREDELLLTL